jgi:SOS response regulatory protein OraA/RecX
MTDFEGLPQRIINYCINLLARYPKTEYEISQKVSEYLRRPAFAQLPAEEKNQIITTVLASLRNMELLNDSAYLESFIRGNNNSLKPDGSLLIIKKMRQKGISQELLAQNISQLEDFDKINAEKLLTKKFHVSSLSQAKSIDERRRMLAYLASRGFKYSTISLD